MPDVLEEDVEKNLLRFARRLPFLFDDDAMGIGRWSSLTTVECLLQYSCEANRLKNNNRNST